MRIPIFGSKSNGTISLDPVCHMEVPVRKPQGGTWKYDGKVYSFCGAGCKRAFQKEPAAYLSGTKKLDM